MSAIRSRRWALGLAGTRLRPGAPPHALVTFGPAGRWDAGSSGEVMEVRVLRSFLMGLVGGQRAMTPLAAVSVAAALGELPADDGPGRLLGHPLVAVGAVALAVGEMAGDKMPSAPDRIVPVGLAARFATSAIAGAALAPAGRRRLGALVGGVTAVIASYPGWRARVAAMAPLGQTATGFAEDAAVLAGAAAIVRAG